MTTESDEKPYMIGDDGVAESEFGKVTFPVPPTGQVYRKFKDAAKRHSAEDDGDFMRLMPHWRGATAIAQFELEGVDSLDFDSVNLEAIRWVVELTDEYLRRFFLPKK